MISMRLNYESKDSVQRTIDLSNHSDHRPKTQSRFSRFEEQLLNALDGHQATRASLDRARFSDKLGTIQLLTLTICLAHNLSSTD